MRSANGVDGFIANSHFIARRIRKVYRREASVIHPPVDVARFQLRTDKQGQGGGHIQRQQRRQHHPARPRAGRGAGGSHAARQALVFAAEEDFGITPLEAQACGTPVIAFGKGGLGAGNPWLPDQASPWARPPTTSVNHRRLGGVSHA